MTFSNEDCAKLASIRDQVDDVLNNYQDESEEYNVLLHIWCLLDVLPIGE